MGSAWTVRGIQWVEYQHGTETWVLWSNGRKHRVEKIDGKWMLEQLGYEVSH